LAASSRTRYESRIRTRERLIRDGRCNLAYTCTRGKPQEEARDGASFAASNATRVERLVKSSRKVHHLAAVKRSAKISWTASRAPVASNFVAAGENVLI